MEHIEITVIGNGQSGLAAAHALLRRGLRPVVPEASGRAAGSWPHCYDSLTLFSPARYSSLPRCRSQALTATATRTADEVVTYLTTHADRLAAGIRTDCRVTVVRRSGDGFAVELEGGGQLSARARKVRSPAHPRPRPAPLDGRTGLDTAPLGPLLAHPPTQPVIDDGRYRAALATGRPDRRPPFTGADGAKLVWPDGQREEVDAIVLTTGYRSDLPYLAGLDGALDAEGNPQHREGLATGVPGLAFVELEWQRSLSSNSLRGVGRGAEGSPGPWPPISHVGDGPPLLVRHVST
ncbi:FAD-dependent oxidoreductase [Streptomyces sp. NPDC102370]|uniref:FAD-dependent oxidoreductase n=1 Tax=Streptomyces sp. NPDC102370 TaxID=3366163 RepID=UPI00382C102A